MNRGQKAFLIVVVGLGIVLWIAGSNSPIPSGRENRDKAKTFVKDHFPDREVSPSDNANSSVAVVFELIRSGEPVVARQAIDFAREEQFGYAAPYAIDRLGSGDPELKRAVQDYLRAIAGHDYRADVIPGGVGARPARRIYSSRRSVSRRSRSACRSPTPSSPSCF